MLLHVWAKKKKKFKIYGGKSEAMTSSTHSFAYSYSLFKKCFIDNYENSQFHISFILYPILIKFSLFCSRTVTLYVELT